MEQTNNHAKTIIATVVSVIIILGFGYYIANSQGNILKPALESHIIKNVEQLNNGSISNFTLEGKKDLGDKVLMAYSYSDENGVKSLGVSSYEKVDNHTYTKGNIKLKKYVEGESIDSLYNTI